jgi:hypothetical protein
MAAIEITARMRELMPDFAFMCEKVNQLSELFDTQTKLVANLQMQRDVLAAAAVELRVENEALKAMLKAKGGAA